MGESLSKHQTITSGLLDAYNWARSTVNNKQLIVYTSSQ